LSFHCHSSFIEATEYANKLKVNQGRDPQDVLSLGAFAHIALRDFDVFPNGLRHQRSGISVNGCFFE
jgi:hypothetical protein